MLFVHAASVNPELYLGNLKSAYDHAYHHQDANMSVSPCIAGALLQTSTVSADTKSLPCVSPQKQVTGKSIIRQDPFAIPFLHD